MDRACRSICFPASGENFIGASISAVCWVSEWTGRLPPKRGRGFTRLTAEPAGEIVGIVEATLRSSFADTGSGAQGLLGGFEPQAITKGAQAESRFAFQFSREMVRMIAGGAGDFCQ